MREIMTKGVPQVDAAASVQDAAKIMNQKRASGVVVFQDGKAVGMLTERSILRRFVKLDKRPDEVKVREVMTPLMKISADASAKDAANKILDNGLTRLGVFDGDNLVGWVTLTDIARDSSKKGIVDSLTRQNQAEYEDEMICPACRSGIMRKTKGTEGRPVVWACPKCLHEE
ncbi:MAG: CBS domain-containing protein [Thaumarchaeota archaeon]|nr:CBS domain-containing protein [Nitrososphaerota archaeon]